ncbi:unnamed protein product [Schistocephalus solidus]|uniref:Secreted protein n=1 Tax=Schistocephalus solidus TaxID=70667 RepID=A0A183SUT5_SCHSO|nr:unnamed protein product [Schistocephalus solidus]
MRSLHDADVLPLAFVTPILARPKGHRTLQSLSFGGARRSRSKADQVGVWSFVLPMVTTGNEAIVALAMSKRNFRINRSRHEISTQQA